MLEYLKNHFDQSYGEMLVRQGSKDNVNIYRPTYKIAQAIGSLTSPNSAIILPHPYGALIHKEKPYDSLGIFAAYDILYPRVLYWEGFEQGTQQKIPAGLPVYRVADGEDQNNACVNGSEPKNLGYYNWYICREENKP